MKYRAVKKKKKMSKNLISMKYKIALLRLGITQREAAKTLGFSESYISMLVSGQRKNKRFNEWLKENVSLEDFKGVTL